MDYTRFDDPTLMHLVMRQDEGALETLYDRFNRLVYSLAFNMLQDETMAEEVTQDVFLSVWKKSNSYDVSHAKVVTWIASIARNRTIDLLRARRARPVNLDISWDDEPSKEIADPSNIEEETELHQSQSQVRLGLSKLPDEQRKVLALAYFGGYSHSEISQILGEPLGTIKTRLRLAMQKLRQFVMDEDRGS